MDRPRHIGGATVIRPEWLIAGLTLGAVVAIVWPGAAVRRRLSTPGPGSAFVLPSLDPHQLATRLHVLALSRPRRLVGSAAVAAAVLGSIVGGPVAGLVAMVYSALAVRALTGRVAKQCDTAARARDLDGLSALAADLRAGLWPSSSSSSSSDAIYVEPSGQAAD